MHLFRKTRTALFRLRICADNSIIVEKIVSIIRRKGSVHTYVEEHITGSAQKDLLYETTFHATEAEFNRAARLFLHMQENIAMSLLDGQEQAINELFS